MIFRIILVAALAGLSPGAGAEPIATPDRAAELMQLQLRSRPTQPPAGSMDGARATAIYKRFSDPAAHPGQPPGTAAPTAGTSQQ